MPFAKIKSTVLIVFAFALFQLLPECNCFAQGLNKTDAQGRKQGAWQKTDAEGKLKYKGQFKDNIPYGKFEYYYPSGKTRAISEFSQNGKVTRTEVYYEGGLLNAKGKYVSEKRDSIWKFYNDSGQLLRSENYKDNLHQELALLLKKLRLPH